MPCWCRLTSRGLKGGWDPRPLDDVAETESLGHARHDIELGPSPDTHSASVPRGRSAARAWKITAGWPAVSLPSVVSRKALDASVAAGSRAVAPNVLRGFTACGGGHSDIGHPTATAVMTKHSPRSCRTDGAGFHVLRPAVGSPVPARQSSGRPEQRKAPPLYSVASVGECVGGKNCFGCGSVRRLDTLVSGTRRPRACSNGLRGCQRFVAEDQGQSWPYLPAAEVGVADARCCDS